MLWIYTNLILYTEKKFGARKIYLERVWLLRVSGNFYIIFYFSFFQFSVHSKNLCNYHYIILLMNKSINMNADRTEDFL